MKNRIGESSSEGVMFARSLEKILRAIVKLLVGRISLVRFEELIRIIFVNECEEYLKKESPNKRANLSQLSLLTGMDTRALTKLTNSESFDRPTHQNEEFLIGMTIESQIIDVWTSDPRFLDKDGRPAALSLSDEKDPSFESLLKSIKRSRGLTTQSIVKRLEQAGSVEVDENSQQLSLISVSYYPFLSRDESALLDVGFHSASLLLDTVRHNRNNLGSEKELLFQRNCFSYFIPKSHRAKVRQQLREILFQSENECRALLYKYEDEQPKPGQIFAGTGMYYFESRQ